MSRTILYKLGLIVAIAAICLFLAWPPQEQIKLGLDLRGGIHLVLDVVVDEAVVGEVQDDLESLRALLADEGIDTVDGLADGIAGLSVTLSSAASLDRAVDLADEYYGTVYDISSRAGDAPTLTLQLTPTHRNDIRDRAVRQALQTIRNRVDQYGVSEPVIQRLGLSGTRILVKLPGVEDPERVKDLIQNTAVLELKLVEAGPAPDREALLEPYQGQLPTGFEVLEEVTEGDAELPGTRRYYLVESTPVVRGTDLKNARLSQDEMGLPAVSFTLNADGARKFATATEQNIGRQLAIVLDERIQSAPVIENRIASQGIIRGNFTVEEAEDLALVLRAGALPASLRYLEERSVGPSLGRESIRRGVAATIVGLVLVVAFMLVYYRGAGVNAIIALALNLVIVLGIMATLRAALTLPGIAGLILLIGMAVDANVIIFERIREELDLGKTVRSAIDAGFGKAFSAIVDANLTTLIAAVFLFQFGTGPVKGFAVTLTIGIGASMFTALFVSRVLFNIWIRRRPATLSI